VLEILLISKKAIDVGKASAVAAGSFFVFQDPEKLFNKFSVK